MANAIYSEEDRARLTNELSLFNNGFISYFVGRLILAFVNWCSLATWFYGIMALLLMYWSVKVFRKLVHLIKLFSAYSMEHC